MSDHAGKPDAPVSPSPFFRELAVEFLIHELKDPLAVVETGLRTLLERRDKYGELSPRQERSLMRSLRGARKARQMLHDLLEVGRAEAGAMECAVFSAEAAALSVLADCLALAGGEGADAVPDPEADPAVIAACLPDYGVCLEIPPAAGDLRLCADPLKFRQILSNLINNGLRHRRHHLRVRLERRADRFFAEVADDGPGIDPRHQEMIFERYRRAPGACPAPAERRGHGLGLAGARVMARHMGGDIILVAGGCGAVFRLDLPAGDAD